MVRLGGGEYDPGSMSSWDAQCCYLDAVAEAMPQVLLSLRDEVLPKYTGNPLTNWYNVQYSPQYRELWLTLNLASRVI